MFHVVISNISTSLCSWLLLGFTSSEQEHDHSRKNVDPTEQFEWLTVVRWFTAGKWQAAHVTSKKERLPVFLEEGLLNGRLASGLVQLDRLSLDVACPRCRKTNSTDVSKICSRPQRQWTRSCPTSSTLTWVPWCPQEAPLECS